MRSCTILSCVSALVWFWATSDSTAEERDFCNPQSPTAAIFIDVTTEFDERQKSLFVDGIQKIVGQFSEGQRIVILTIEDTFTASSRLYEGCVPYCETSEGWDWFLDAVFGDCTSGLVKLKKREQQSTITNALRKRLGRTKDLPHSEIVRTLSYALKPLIRTSNGIHLYIFSDMIENSEYMPGRSFWTNPIQKSLGTLATDDLIPNLMSAEVFAFGVGRAGTAGRRALPQEQLKKIQAFWTSYFEKAGANDVTISESLSVDR